MGLWPLGMEDFSIEGRERIGATKRSNAKIHCVQLNRVDSLLIRNIYSTV